MDSREVVGRAGQAEPLPQGGVRGDRAAQAALGEPGGEVGDGRAEQRDAVGRAAAHGLATNPRSPVAVPG